jgi:hypothetical protein
MLMIDPDFHNHYDAPTADCPNVDAYGNCLGKWFWEPSNLRKELFGLVKQPVTIPHSVIASLAPGYHKLVFLSTDVGECIRGTMNATYPNGNLAACPPDVRGSWTTVSVLPFRVT